MRTTYLVIGRLLSPISILFLRLFTLITKTERVRVIVINEKKEVLLLRGVISDGKWSLPGGGIERHEQPVEAAQRELKEETGIDANEKEFHYLTTLEKVNTRASYRAPLFLLRTQSSSLPDNPVNQWEIARVGWFKMSDLPPSISELTKVALRTYKVDF